MYTILLCPVKPFLSIPPVTPKQAAAEGATSLHTKESGIRYTDQSGRAAEAAKVDEAHHLGQI